MTSPEARLSLGTKQPTQDWMAVLAQFDDVRCRAMLYPVASSTVATDYIEVSVLVILSALLNRQPIPKKSMTSLLWFVRVTEFTEPVPDRLYQAPSDHDSPSATDQSREEQRLLCHGIKNARDCGVAGSIAYR